MSDDAKPCPFCGKTELETQDVGDSCWMVSCKHCQCLGPSAGQQDDAMRYWNEWREPEDRHLLTGVHEGQEKRDRPRGTDPARDDGARVEQARQILSQKKEARMSDTPIWISESQEWTDAYYRKPSLSEQADAFIPEPPQHPARRREWEQGSTFRAAKNRRTMSDARECPFCGSEPEKYMICGVWEYRCRCFNARKPHTREWWNTRPTEDRLRAELAESQRRVGELEIKLLNERIGFQDLRARLQRAVGLVARALRELTLQSIPHTRKRDAWITEAQALLDAEKGEANGQD